MLFDRHRLGKQALPEDDECRRQQDHGYGTGNKHDGKEERADRDIGHQGGKEHRYETDGYYQHVASDGPRQALENLGISLFEITGFIVDVFCSLDEVDGEIN